MFFNKYVHEVVTIDTDFIDARFHYETQPYMFQANSSPETCRAELKRLINEKVVASCWLFTSLY